MEQEQETERVYIFPAGVAPSDLNSRTYPAQGGFITRHTVTRMSDGGYVVAVTRTLA